MTVDDKEIPVILKLSQWQFVADVLSRANVPWIAANPVIATIISAGQAATAPAPSTEEPNA